MNALIIGGNRFFGRRLAERLLEHKVDVTLLNRQTLDDKFGDKVRRIKCDRTDGNALKNAIGIQKWDVVFDQVCYAAHEARQASQIFEGRCGRYVFTSTQSVYLQRGLKIKESAFEPQTHRFTTAADPKTEYGEAKRQCEAVFFQDSKLNLTAVRFPYVIGLDDYTERLRFHVNRVKNQKPIYFPNIDAETSFIHAQEAADALFVLGTSEYRGPLNCASPDSISLRSLINTIEDTTGTKGILVPTDVDSNAHSPYGSETSSTIDVSRAQSVGLRFQLLQRWLPDLIRQLSI